MKSKSVAEQREARFPQALLAKAVSPMIATTILIAVAIAIAGIAYVWTSSYTTTITEQVTEQAGPEIIESPAISQALTIKSALSNGRIIISNDGITEVIIDKVVVDGNIVFIVPPVTIPAGSQAVIDLNMTLSPGMRIGLLTSTGVGTEIVLTADEFPVTSTGMEESIMFRDLLDNTNDINLSATTATISGGLAKLSSVYSWAQIDGLNLSNNSGNSQRASLALDANNGFPSIAWQDNTSGNDEIYYRDWNGTNWVTVKGNLLDADLNVSNTPGWSSNPSLALDINGNPSMAWYDDTSGNTEIYYRDWNGSNWVTVKGNLSDADLNVSKNSGWSGNPSLALDINGFPSIAWQDNTSGNDEIYYRDWNGTNWVDSSRPDWLSGWNYRKKFDINGTVDGILTNYQLKLYVKRSTGTDLNGTVFVGMNVLSDYNDLRFTRADGNTLLDYWIEDANSDTGIVWIEFNSILASPTATSFYLYYGNSGASAASNGNSTFLFFDNFNDNSIDAIKWTTENVGVGTVTEAGGLLKLDITSPTASATARISSVGKVTFSSNFDLQIDWLNLSMPNPHVQGAVGVEDSTPEYFAMDRRNGYGGSPRLMAARYLSGVYAETPIAVATSSGKFRLTRIGSVNTSYYWNGSIWVQGRTDTDATGNMFVRMHLINDASTLINGHIDWDNLIVKNITTNEPFITNWRVVEESRNVSNNSGISTNPSLALDVNGNPGIAWHDDTSGNTEIYYRDWNRTNWVTASRSTGVTDLNVSNTPGTSDNPSLALIIQPDGAAGKDAKVTTFSSGTNYGTAVFMEVRNDASYQSRDFIQFDLSSIPSGAVITSAYMDLYNHQTDVVTPPTVVSVYQIISPWGELTVTWNLQPTTSTTIASGSFSGVNVWRNFNVTTAVKNWFSGAWTNYGMMLANASNGGNPNQMVFRTSDDTNTETRPKLTINYTLPKSVTRALVLDVNGNPSIAWDDNTSGNYDIYFRDWNGSNWVTAGGTLKGIDLNVSNTTGTSASPSLALDSQGNPSIAWDELLTSNNTEVYYRKWSGSNWVTIRGNSYDSDVNASKNDANSFYPWLAMDLNNNLPNIAWSDYSTGNNEIYFKKAIPGYSAGSVVQSSEVDTTAYNITKATLRGNTLTPGGTSISFFLSNNNGSTWQAAAPGNELTFASTGSQLRWRADLNTDNSLITPKIYDVNINYVYIV